MPLELKVAESPEDIVMVFRAYKAMHDEGLAPGTFDGGKALSRIMRWVAGPNSFVLMVMDGDNLAGVVTMIEETYWWSKDDSCLADKGLYVLPEYRDGGAFELLLGAVRDASSDLGVPAAVTIQNIKRKRGARTAWERIGATLGFGILGAIIAHRKED